MNKEADPEPSPGTPVPSVPFMSCALLGGARPSSSSTQCQVQASPNLVSTVPVESVSPVIRGNPASSTGAV